MAIERASKRKRQVPEEYIRIVYEKIKPLKAYYKNEFNFFKEVNNNEGEFNDKAILNAFKSVLSFYTEPVQNPLGIDLINKMRENKAKYLLDLKTVDPNIIKNLEQVVSN